MGFDYRTSTGLGKHSWRAQTKPCAHQEPEERSRDRVRLACECPGVSWEAWVGGGLLAGSGALSETVGALDLLKEGAIILITSTIVWSQVKQGGNTAPPISRKLDKIH